MNCTPEKSRIWAAWMSERLNTILERIGVLPVAQRIDGVAIVLQPVDDPFAQALIVFDQHDPHVVFFQR